MFRRSHTNRDRANLMFCKACCFLNQAVMPALAISGWKPEEEVTQQRLYQPPTR